MLALKNFTWFVLQYFVPRVNSYFCALLIKLPWFHFLLKGSKILKLICFHLKKQFAWNKHCVESVQIRIFFWPVFPPIRTEYGEIRSTSLYSVRMLANTDQKNSVLGHISHTLIMQIIFLNLVQGLDISGNPDAIKAAGNLREVIHDSLGELKRVGHNELLYATFVNLPNPQKLTKPIKNITRLDITKRILENMQLI